ncbi:hypothetical protein BGZ46_006249 [Entomortierella lignicola]|nr:hypothetical protein BGZ46_006249 [Entomortierella lignicola]
MSTNSPRSSAPSSIASGNISSKDSNASVSPTTPTKSRPIAAMAITDLVISEAHYLTAIKRVTNALDRFTESTLAAGRKESAVIRSLIDRWTEMMRVHARFHDDVISTNEDLREIAALISSLLVTIEPMLVDHSRELSNSLKKLTRRDQSSAHSFAEWDSFLRQPFEHLISYDEWLQRIDPQSNFCKEYRAHLNGVIYKIKMAAEANPQPRNMLSRLSTMARGVIKRRSSVQIADVDPSAPQTPATPDTPLSTHMTDSNNTLSTNVDRPNFHHFTKRHSSVLLFLPETVKNLAVTDHEKTTEVVMESMSSSNINNNDQEKEREQEKELPTIRNMDESDLKEPSTPITDTFLAPIHAVRQLQHQSSTPSELSSAGTLAIENSPSLVYSSDSSTYSESSSCAETLQGRPINSASSLARQKFLAEKENRKATLRIGTSVAIQAKTESLHSPSSATKSSIESLRKASPVTSASDKPPVKSLINFWEQVSDPLDD